MTARRLPDAARVDFGRTRRGHDFGHPHAPGGRWRTFAVCLLASAAAVSCVMFPPDAGAADAPRAVAAATSAAPAPRYALVTQDALALRSGPRSGGAPLASLTPGELLEVRGERMDYLQVYDTARERGGYVRAGAVRVLALTPDEAPELLALVRFLRDRPGSESLGLGLAAAWLKAAPAGAITAEGFDAMGTLAQRLAARANAAAANAANAPVRPGEPGIAAQLEVARGLGVHFIGLEHDGRVVLCDDGDAFRHVLALSPTPVQAARAALALTRAECIADTTPPLQRWQLDRARAELLARVPVDGLPAYLRNRLRLRQAGVWAALAFEDGRRLATESGSAVDGLPPVGAHDVAAAGNAALDALAGVDKAELADDDQSAWADAAMRVGASRWAAEPATAAARAGLHVETRPGEPGETCVLLVDAAHGVDHPLARRCTFGTVWTASARADAASTALALAVQPLAAWRELWLFRATPQGWTLQVLPPSTEATDVGYVEFAGWVPGTGQVLAAREVRDPQHGGRPTRTFEVLDGRTLATLRSADAPGALSAFARFQDPAWKRLTVSLR